MISKLKNTFTTDSQMFQRIHLNSIFMVVKICSTMFLFLLLTSCSSNQDSSSGDKGIDIIQVASIKGKIFSEERDGIHIGGFSLLSSKIKEIQENNNIADPVLIGNSNFIFGTPEAYFTEGEAVIELMNKLQFDLLVVGHRELYFGKHVFTNLAQKAQFPFVSANIVDADGSIPPYIKPYVIFPDINLAVIGVTTHMFIETNIAEDLQGLTLIPMDIAIKKYVKELQRKNIKHIFLVGDLLSGGAEGVIRNETLHRILNAEGISSYFVRSREVNEDIGVVEFINTKDERKEILPCEDGGEMIGHYRLHNGVSSYKIMKISSESTSPDSSLTDYLVALKNVIEDIAGGIIGHSEVDITHDFKKESSLGNFITDVCRQHIQSDIFIFNSGNMRQGFKKGPISKIATYNVLPWGGTLVETELTGNQLLQILEASCSFRLEKSFLSVSGMSFQYDSSREKGHRVIPETIKINGKPFDPDKVYSLGTDRYIFDGGDRYSEFHELNLPMLRVRPKSIRELVMEYITNNITISSKVEGRIIDINQ